MSYGQELISEIKKNPKILNSCIQKKGPETVTVHLRWAKVLSNPPTQYLEGLQPSIGPSTPFWTTWLCQYPLKMAKTPEFSPYALNSLAPGGQIRKRAKPFYAA